MITNIGRVARGEAATHAELSGNLRAAARLVALVADQVDAAGQGQDEWVAWLDEQRDVLRREAFASGCEPGEEDVIPAIADGIARLVDQADGILTARSDEEQRLHDWIDVLESAAFPALHECGRWTPVLHGGNRPVQRTGATPH